MRRLGALGLLCVAGVLSLSPGCKSKKKKPSAPPPEVTGLAAVPATAQALIAADVKKLADAEIVGRAVDQLLLKDVGLAQRWADVREQCKIDLVAQVRHVMLALGPPTGPGAEAGPAGSGSVLMVATGALSETELVACLPKVVGGGGGGLTTRSVGGRSLYQVKDGNRVMFFAFGRPDTVVFGTNEAWVLEALGSGKKALDNPEIARWLDLVDQKSPLWAVGRVDPRVGRGLVGASGGKLTQPPEAFVGTVDPRDGARVSLGVVMGSSALAKELESFARAELAIVAMAAQLRSLGPIVGKVGVATDGVLVRFRVALTQPEVNQLLSVLDEAPDPAQVTPPAADPPEGTSPAP